MLSSFTAQIRPAPRTGTDSTRRRGSSALKSGRWSSRFTVPHFARVLRSGSLVLRTADSLQTALPLVVLGGETSARRPAILNPVPLQQFQPMTLDRVRDAFSDPDWLFELKWDGFRALLHSDADGVRRVSRNGNAFRSFPGLCEGLADDLRGRRCVLDGEIVCLDAEGRSQFTHLLFRRAEPYFYAFDLLWMEDAGDLRHLPLIKRKLSLRALVPRDAERLLYCDHVAREGEELFRLAVEHDLEGIVAKHKHHPYAPEQKTTWSKIRNREYSQWAGREELFERERHREPMVPDWEGCARAAFVSG